MSGLAMEIKGSHLVVLTSQGEFIRIRNYRIAAIGDIISFESQAAPPFKRITASIKSWALNSIHRFKQMN